MKSIPSLDNPESLLYVTYLIMLGTSLSITTQTPIAHRHKVGPSMSSGPSCFRFRVFAKTKEDFKAGKVCISPSLYELFYLLSLFKYQCYILLYHMSLHVAVIVTSDQHCILCTRTITAIVYEYIYIYCLYIHIMLYHSHSLLYDDS